MGVSYQEKAKLDGDKGISFSGTRNRIHALGKQIDADIERDIAKLPPDVADGLALGGEYGGAATYVAEHSPRGKRGAFTSWIQTTATLGFFLSLLIVLGSRLLVGEARFSEWGCVFHFCFLSCWFRCQPGYVCH